MKPTTRLLAAGAAALGAGILAIGPLQALAQDDDNGGWVDDALDELVDDGTLTRDQADAVADALEEARPEHRPGRGGPWWPGKFLFGPSLLGDAADAIGVDEDELLDALGEGETIAELAEEQGVDPQSVIDALVDAVQERLDEAVADGDIEQDAADERLADATERITEFVNEGFELRHPLPFPRSGGDWLGEDHSGPWHRHHEDEDESSEDTTPDTGSPETTTPDTTSPGGS